MPGLEAQFDPNQPAARYARLYFQNLGQIMDRVDPDVIQQIIDKLIQTNDANHTVYFVGNGGSAAIAAHYANDLGIGARSDGRRPFKAVSLVDNQAVLSCVANDFGYDNVFVKQLEMLLEPGDTVVAMSVSGNSQNILRAVEYARVRGAYTIGLVGFDGGRLRGACDCCLYVPTPRGEYGPVEDLFQVLCHLITSYLQLMRRGHLQTDLVSTRQPEAVP